MNTQHDYKDEFDWESEREEWLEDSETNVLAAFFFGAMLALVVVLMFLVAAK